MPAAHIMLATFSQVALGCLQSINVVEDRPGWTAVTSIAQSLAALFLYRHAAEIGTADAVVAFVAGGMMGGQFAMIVARWRRRKGVPR